jgi:PmbA protein
MIGQEKIFAAMDAALSEAKDEAVIACRAGRFGLTRFASSYVHQNTLIDQASISIRAKIGQRIGVATTNSLDPKDLIATLRKAEAIAEAGPPIPSLRNFPGPQEYPEVPTFVQATADFNPADRAGGVKLISDLARTEGAIASGLLSSGHTEAAVANTSGLRAYAPLTAAELMVVMGDDRASGYAGSVFRDVGEIDFEKAGKTALDKCIASRSRVSIEPGKYEVVLEPAAVAGALEWLGLVGFGSKSYEDGTSFLAGRQGELLVGKNVTIRDDGTDPRALGVPFDFEGMPKIKQPFFELGVVGKCVYDTLGADRAGGHSTGHSRPIEEAGFGSMALNVIMDGGTSSLDEMIASVEKGILVTRFHYINGFIDTRNAVLTGMTRDGTFLIENGKLVGGLPNLRFMQSFLTAFRNVKAITRDVVPKAGWWNDTGAFVTPGLQIEDFNFIGVQQED